MKSIKIYPLAKPIKAEILIPGSKSYTNRALVIAAMIGKSVEITNPLISDDTLTMIDCLKKLGIQIKQQGSKIQVNGNLQKIKEKEYILDAKLSGTAIRFLLALSTIIPGTKIIKGEKSLNNRPIGDLVNALKILGANIEYLSRENFPPVKVTSSKLTKNKTTLNGSISSQFLSAILMIAPITNIRNIKINDRQVSKPYIGMTIDIMKHFGVTVKNRNYTSYIIPHQQYNIVDYSIEGDYSSAAYFAGIAVLTGSSIILKNLKTPTAQGDFEFMKILEKMGSKIIARNNEIKIVGTGVKPLSVDMENCPDQIQTLSVLAAFAKGKTKITGIQTLRVKETDRVKAIAAELAQMGIKTRTTRNSLEIFGGNPHSAAINTYNDHRMAMAFAIAGTKLEGMIINNLDAVTKTFPDFWKKLNSIGIKTETANTGNIVLIGMRGSGKTTIAKLLSQKLNREYLELDELMVKKAGLSIPNIVKRYGWEYFRDQESDIAKMVSSYNNTIISTGGGIVTRNKNIKAIKKNGVIIYLRTRIETLSNRIGNDSNRPSLTNKKTRREEMEELLKQRKKLYEQAADEIIDTDNLKPEEVTNQILLRIKEGNI